MNVRTSRALSLRSFLKHTMMCVHLSTSSAYSKRDTNPSLEPSGRRYEGTCMYSLCCQSTVSQETSVFSVSRSRNVRRRDECCSAASSKSFSVTILLWLRGWLTESSFGFPTPLPSVLIGDTLNAAWGASGPPLRPCPQRYTVLRAGITLFTIIIQTRHGF